MKKLIALLTSLVLCFSIGFALTACNQDTLIIATSADFEPFEYLEKGKIVGFDIDLMKLVGEKIGMKIKFENVGFNGIVTGVSTNVYQCGMSGLTYTDERALSVAFSESYYDNEQVLVVLKSDTTYDEKTKEQIDEALAVKSLKVGVCDGYAGQYYAVDVKGADEKNLSASNILGSVDFATAIMALEAKTTECIIMDKTVALRAVAKPDSKIKIINVTLITETYGVIFNKNNTELKQKVDNAIKELKADGSIANLIEKWEV